MTTAIPVLRATPTPVGALRRTFRQLIAVAHEWRPETAADYRGQLAALTPHLPLDMAEQIMAEAAACVATAGELAEQPPPAGRPAAWCGADPDGDAEERSAAADVAAGDALTVLAELISQHPYAPTDGTPLVDLVPELALRRIPPPGPCGVIPTDRDLHAEQHGYQVLVAAFPHLARCLDFSSAVAALIREYDGLVAAARAADAIPVPYWPAGGGI